MYVTKEDVRKVCSELGMRDWSQLTSPIVTLEEAEIIQKKVGGEALEISVEAFQQGLEVELEHGVGFSDANVTNNHPILTGKIVLAHLKESLDYYLRLEIAELEGDMLKALLAGNHNKLAQKYKKLLLARLNLCQYEVSLMNQGD